MFKILDCQRRWQVEGGYIRSIDGWKHNQVDHVVYFFGLNYKYLQIYLEIVKHVIWLGKKIEVNMVFDFMWKNTIKTYLINS
jgi:hypothetical protein